MPRNRQYQPAQAPNQQAYGVKNDQLQAQREMPLPQVDNKIPSGGAAAVSPGAPSGGAPAPMDIMQLAREYDPGITPLNAPTARPGEPVTAGLSLGPGPGPEIFQAPGRQARAADTLAMMARISGDDFYLQMAERIRQGGGFR